MFVEGQLMQRTTPSEAVSRTMAAKKFFEEALARKDPSALAILEQNKPWECITCGCSDEFGSDGERICGCDTCHRGCESDDSRVKRGAKRAEDDEKVFDLLKVLALKCEQVHKKDSIEKYTLVKFEQDSADISVALTNVKNPDLEPLVEVVKAAMKKTAEENALV